MSLNIPLKKSTLIAATCAAGLALAACSTDGATDTATDAAPTTVATSPDDTAEIPTELQFTSSTLDGTPVNGADFAGEATVFWFWAPWCAVCQREAPALADAAEQYGSDINFVGVAAQDNVGAMEDFVNKYNVTEFPHLNDGDASVWSNFGVTQQPAFAFVTAEGDVDVVRGTMSPGELTDRLDSLTGQ